ncbi:MAG: Zn-ribbon domain-containing OB-fold protein [Dehalococcoidia bacterium]|nr:MAG: Zn-ribbon domain-containing OB-fold protein [Dehalococcoidia bacterium]
MPTKKQVPIIEGLFTWPSDKPQLIASRCKKCRTVTFPKAAFCANPDCEKVRENVEVIKLSNSGTLWSFTTQIYAPPAPFKKEPVEPYGIGMIDTKEGLRVLGILTTTDNVKIGMPVEMTAGKLYEDDENEYITWMWKPVD